MTSDRMGFWFSFCNMILAVAMVVYPHLYTTHGFIILSVIRAGFGTHLVTQRMSALSVIVLPEKLNAALGLVLFGNALGAVTGRGLGGKLLSMVFHYDHIIWRYGHMTPCRLANTGPCNVSLPDGTKPLSEPSYLITDDVLWHAFENTSTGWC